MSDKENTCETCAFWTKNPKTDEFSSYGECPWYTIEYGMLRVAPDGEGNFRPFGSFGCVRHEDKPAGPFVAQDSTFVHSTHLLFGDDGEAFTVSVERDEAERLFAWLNKLWAEREVGE